VIHLNGDGLHPCIGGRDRQNADACRVAAIWLRCKGIDDGDWLRHISMVAEWQRQSGLLRIAGFVSAKCRMNSPKSVLAHANHARVKSAALSFWKDSCRKWVPAVVSRSVRSFRDCISRNQTNWAVIAAASPGWALRVFPDAPAGKQMDLLWDAIRRLCRLDQPDPIGAWERHLKALAARRDYLNEKRYDALKYRAPGTDLTIGLAPGHCWVSGRSLTRSGIPFAPNLPTEEVFTMPHKDHVSGTVRSSKPLSYAGTLIENFTMRFEAGRIVQVAAQRGEGILKQLIDTDPGSARLGEVALVPDNSPVAQSKVLFYNTLFDENAASHVALGSAYKFTISGGETMSDEEFERAGGNRSATHVDFMIGSSQLDIDGVLANGRTEPLMRRGDWVRNLES